MVAKKSNIGTSWVEPFDLDRLEQIAKDVQSGRGTNGEYSDMECYVHSLMKMLADNEPIR